MQKKAPQKPRNRVIRKIIRDFHTRAFGEEAARVHALPVGERIRYMQRLRKRAIEIREQI